MFVALMVICMQGSCQPITVPAVLPSKEVCESIVADGIADAKTKGIEVLDSLCVKINNKT